MINHMMEVSTVHTHTPSTDYLVEWHAKHMSLDSNTKTSKDKDISKKIPKKKNKNKK